MAFTNDGKAVPEIEARDIPLPSPIFSGFHLSIPELLAVSTTFPRSLLSPRAFFSKGKSIAAISNREINLTQRNNQTVKIYYILPIEWSNFVKPCRYLKNQFDQSVYKRKNYTLYKDFVIQIKSAGRKNIRAKDFSEREWRYKRWIVSSDILHTSQQMGCSKFVSENWK